MTPGTQREVVHEDIEQPTFVETYTIPEAAAALGKSVPNFRRWLERDLVPMPYLQETSRHLRVYTVGELDIIRQELAMHEQEFAYYCAQHEDVRHRMFQRIQGYRAHHI